MLMLCLKRNTPLRLLRLTHDLDLGAASPDIVKHQLRSARTLDVDAARDPNLLGRVCFAGLVVRVILHELADVCVDVELVGVRVRLFGFAETVDAAGSDFKVLL